MLQIRGRRRRSRPRLAALLALTAVVLAGCGGEQSTLNPASRPARRITTFWWDMMIGAWIGLGLVCALLLLAWVRRKRAGFRGGDGEKASWIVVVLGGIAMPIGVVATLFVLSDILLIKDTQAPAAATTRLTVRVVGHQWWWEARYPGTRAVTADEIHIPARTRVNLEVQSDDVIHSFWVPQLNRKIDTIPGRTNRILLYADRPGRYRGECAEFCGLQHAHMSLTIVADPPARFRAWLANQARSARAPPTTLERAGRRSFLDGPCSSCHTIRGTDANGDVGPDLTHLATRDRIAGLVLSTGKADLARWITDNQHVKPGNQMPDVDVSGARLKALLAYLESLR